MFRRLADKGVEIRLLHAGTPSSAALRELIEFHVDFALDEPAVIALHLHELDRLPEESRRKIRRLQRLYVEVWVEVINALHPHLTADEARVLAHAAFGLMNSTPFIGTGVERVRRAALLRTSTLAALNQTITAGHRDGPAATAEPA